MIQLCEHTERHSINCNGSAQHNLTYVFYHWDVAADAHRRSPARCLSGANPSGALSKGVCVRLSLQEKQRALSLIGKQSSIKQEFTSSSIWDLWVYPKYLVLYPWWPLSFYISIATGSKGQKPTLTLATLHPVTREVGATALKPDRSWQL